MRCGDFCEPLHSVGRPRRFQAKAHAAKKGGGRDSLPTAAATFPEIRPGHSFRIVKNCFIAGDSTLFFL